MNIRSLLNKRNYLFLYYILKPFPFSVKKRKGDFIVSDSIENICNSIGLDNYKKIVVVASGPSAGLLYTDTDSIYFCTNRSIELVRNDNFFYMVSDFYYLIKYLKTFKSNSNWKGTIFWYFSSNSVKGNKVFKILKSYLQKKKRTQKEFLISQEKRSVSSSQVHFEIVQFLKKKFNFDFYGVNSGFVTVVLGFVLAHHSDLDLEIYGLDMGENGEGYFNSTNVEVGTSIKGDFSKLIVEDFLNKIYLNSKVKVKNHSYFKTHK